MELKSIASGQMVSDYDEWSIPENGYPDALNIRVSQKLGLVNDLKGNIPLTGSPLPAGANVAVGSCEDEATLKIYTLIKNKLGSHSLLEIDTISNTYKTLILDRNNEVLKLNNVEYVASMHVISGGDYNEYGVNTSTMLVYTDTQNEIKNININKVAQLTIAGSTLAIGDDVYNGNIKGGSEIRYVLINGIWNKVLSVDNGKLKVDRNNGNITMPSLTYSYYGTVTEKEIMLAKAPPIVPPIAFYGSDANKLSNNVFGGIYQFIYMFEYDNFERSAWSVTSNLPLPTNKNQEPNIENVINVSFNTGDRMVKKIHLGFREVLSAPNDYFKIEVLDKEKLNYADNSSVTYVFDKSTIASPIPFAEINNLDFDRVPMKAGCLTPVDNGALAIGDVTDGRALPVVDLKGTLAFDTAPVTLASAFSLKYLSRYKIGVVYGDDFGRRTPVVTSATGIVDTVSIYDADGKIQKIEWQINSLAPSWATWYSIVMTKNLTTRNSYYGIASKLEIKAEEPSIAYVHISNLQAQEVAFGVDYITYKHVKGNRIKILKEAEATSYLQSVFDTEIIDDTFVKENDVEKRVLKVNTTTGFPNSLFTDSATKPVLFEAYTPKVQSDIDNVFYHTGNTFRIASGGLHTADLQSQTANQPAKGFVSISDSFIRLRNIPFTEGDVASTEDGVNLSVGRSTDWSTDDGYFDAISVPLNEVVVNSGNAWDGSSFRASSNKTVNIKVDFNCVVRDFYRGGSDPESWVQLRKNNQVLAQRLYRTNREFNDTSYNNQSLSASTAMNVGDKITFTVFHPTARRIRTTMKKVKLVISAPTSGQIVESFEYTDRNNAKMLTFGTATIEDSSFKEVRRKATIYHTDPFIPNTNINGLNRIYSGYFKDFGLDKGAFKRLVNKGNYIIGIQESETINIPIGRSIISSADGGTQIGLSTELINSGTYYNGKFGLGQNTSALVNTGDTIYTIDAIRGCFVALDLAGLRDLGIINGFSRIIRQLCESTRATVDQIRLGFDVSESEVIISFPNMTLVYSEKTKGLVSRVSYQPECMNGLGDLFYSFKDGLPYQHNVGIPNRFYGVNYKSSITYVFNNGAEQFKLFRAVRLVVNQLNLDTCLLSTEQGCQTDVIESDFEYETMSTLALPVTSVDGGFVAPIPMDKNSDGGMIDGLPMRGGVLKFELNTRNNGIPFEIRALQLYYISK